jgi:hypothetical protein
VCGCSCLFVYEGACAQGQWRGAGGDGRHQLVKYHNRKVLFKVKEEMRDAIVEMLQTDNSPAVVWAAGQAKHTHTHTHTHSPVVEHRADRGEPGTCR